VVDAASASLVQQQLATLDAGRAGWSGLVLPGVPAGIVVQERPAPSEDDAEETPEPAADWATTVSVVLPRLGAVDARLLLRGDRLLLSVAAEEASGADELAAAREHLVSALADAGLKARMLLQVHDELVFELPEGDVAAARQVIEAVMAGAAEPAVKLTVPLGVEIGTGPSWGAAH
jgi:hypothetical protein